VSRFTTLPDPFVATLRALPGFREFTEGYQLCPECERCERSVVYLTPREQESARSLGLRMYGRGGGTRINRQGCRCPFYEGPARGCEIYVDRPLICNLFPLDVIEREEDGLHWWVLFGACAEVERGRLRGRIAEARALATAIDRVLTDELRLAFMADAEGAVFEPEFYEHPIHYLLPLTPPGEQEAVGIYLP
jgi:Fe-S-cluster containining protein